MKQVMANSENKVFVIAPYMGGKIFGMGGSKAKRVVMRLKIVYALLSKEFITAY